MSFLKSRVRTNFETTRCLFCGVLSGELGLCFVLPFVFLGDKPMLSAGEGKVIMYNGTEVKSRIQIWLLGNKCILSGYSK